MPIRCGLLLLISLALAAPARLAAQAPPARAAALDLVEGDLVRVSSPLLPVRPVGELLALERDTLRLRPEGGGPPLALALGGLEHIELYGGRDHNRGMIVGAVLGGLAGAAVGLAMEGARGEEFIGGLPPTAIAVAITAPIGAVVGYLLAPDQWDSVWSIWDAPPQEEEDEEPRQPRRRR